jgi:hypothetical protein
MDLLEASIRRIPIAVETWPGEYRLACEVFRLHGGKVAWVEDAWLLDFLYPPLPFHLLDEEPTGEGPEWRSGRLRFVEVDGSDDELMHHWRLYEGERARRGPEAVRAKALEIAEREFGTTS